MYGDVCLNLEFTHSEQDKTMPSDQFHNVHNLLLVTCENYYSFESHANKLHGSMQYVVCHNSEVCQQGEFKVRLLLTEACHY